MDKNVSYYDGTKLLSMLDADGKKPELFFITSNRSAGKTTYFAKMCVNQFIKHKKKFLLLYRYKYEVNNCEQRFYPDVRALFFNECEMTGKNMNNKSIRELFINDETCGYAVAINCADAVKKSSHLFNDVETILFDEFQSETNQYLPNEINKFISIHTSVARGHGVQSRYVRTILIGNPVSISNPYYKALGIDKRLTKETVYLKGNGWVLEQGFNASASKANQESSFMAAFKDTSQADYVSRGTYLNDDYDFIYKYNPDRVRIDKPLCNITVASGNVYTLIVSKNYEYGLITDKVITDLRVKLSIGSNREGFTMVTKNNIYARLINSLYSNGCLFFSDVTTKNDITNDWL